VTDFTEASNPPPDPPPRVPFRVRLRKVAVRVLVVVAVVALVVGTVRRQAERNGEKLRVAILTKLDDEEPGWRMEAIEAERRERMPPPDKNGALVVLAAGEKIDGEWERKWFADAVWAARLPEPYLPSPKHIAQLKAADPPSAEARTIALALRDLPTGHFPVTFPADSYTLLHPHLSKALSVSVLLEYDACFAVFVDGDPNRAVKASHAALNVARALGDEPTLGAQCVRSTCRSRAARSIIQTLAWSRPTVGLADLQEALLAEAAEPLFLRAMRGHRADMHRFFSGLEAGRLTYRDVVGSVGIREPWLARPEGFRAYRPFLPGDHAEAMRRLNAAVAAAKLPPHEQFAAVVALRYADTNDFRHAISNTFVRHIDSTATMMLVSRAELETTAVGIACERFRLVHGRWPRDLAEIPNTILPALPRNPFDAQPLRYRVFNDRLAIWYHAAHDTLRCGEPEEFGEPDEPGITIGVRLWNPEFRASPPKPDPE